MKNDKKILVTIAVIAIIIVALMFGYGVYAKKYTALTKLPETSSSKISSTNLNKAVKRMGEKIDAQGEVQVSVTPTGPWAFKISLDTHSVELNEDIVQITELIDDKGTAHKPLAWKGDTGDSHHKSGVLEFRPISPSPQKIKLIIKGVGGIAKRIFEW